jgi:branched-chain amino acid transport system permease protein
MNTFGQLLISGVLIGSIYALMSVGLTLVFGVLRIVNFAHGEFLMIAMYGAWAITHSLGLNPYFAVLAIVPAMALFGGLVYVLIVKPGLDKPHLVVVFATMGLSIFLQNVALMAMTVLCTLALQWTLKSTYIGKAIRATVQDGEAAMLMGVPVPKLFLLTFAAGSALVGLAACIMMPLFSVFPTVGLNFVLIAFVIVVLGGMGSIGGALLGGVCVGVVQSLSSYYIAPAFGQMFFFILFLLVMIFRPNGLLGQKGTANLGMN